MSVGELNMEHSIPVSIFLSRVAMVGIAIRVPDGLRFVASDPDFRSVDGQVFPRARLLVNRIAELGRALRKRRAGRCFRSGI